MEHKKKMDEAVKEKQEEYKKLREA